MSVSMLWKVENGQTELTYSKLVKLAEGFEVPIGELFAETAPALRKGGRRVVDRRGAGPVIDVQSNLHHFLAADLAQKHCFPCIVDVKATGSGFDSEAHGGEEFALVLEGEVRFHCEGYEPVVLEVGDSVYFDASMPHRYLRANAEPARIICVYSHPEHARLDVPAQAQPHSAAMRAFGSRHQTSAVSAPKADDAPAQFSAEHAQRRTRG